MNSPTIVDIPSNFTQNIVIHIANPARTKTMVLARFFCAIFLKIYFN
jgi:hypothetical protein